MAAPTTDHHSYKKLAEAGHYRDVLLNASLDAIDNDVPVHGEASFDGDGAITTFNIAHGMSVTPTDPQVTAKSADAAADFYVSAVDGTNITVEYVAAPGTGTDNVVLSWTAYPS